MKQQITESQFRDAFKHAGRKNDFSYEGLTALWDYFQDIEEQTNEEIELDVIAICCDYKEYDSLKDFQDDYGNKYKTIEDIKEKTTVLKIDEDRFIIQEF